MSRLGLAALLALAACGSSASAPDPIKVRCAPHWKMELDCGDAEMRKALVLIGDLCQKALNGKNPQVFGPAARRRMEAELGCAQSAKDCAAYATCKDSVGDQPGPTLPALPR